MPGMFLGRSNNGLATHWKIHKQIANEWTTDTEWLDDISTYVYHGDSTIYVYRVSNSVYVRGFGPNRTEQNLPVSYSHNDHTTHIAEIDRRLCLIANNTRGDGVMVIRGNTVERGPPTRFEHCEMTTASDGMCYAANCVGDSPIIPGFSQLQVGYRENVGVVARSAIWAHGALYASVHRGRPAIYMRDPRMVCPEVVYESSSDIIGRDSMGGDSIYLNKDCRYTTCLDLRNYREYHVIDLTDETVIACIG